MTVTVFRLRVPECQPFSYNVGKRNSNFQFRFSFTNAIGKGNSRFHFRLPFSCYVENGIPTFIFVFRFPTTLDNHIGYWKTEFELRFSSFVSVFLSLSYVTWIGRILALPVANERPGNHILDDEVFIRRFLTEENSSYEDLLEVIKNRYPIRRGCTVVC